MNLASGPATGVRCIRRYVVSEYVITRLYGIPLHSQKRAENWPEISLPHKAGRMFHGGALPCLSTIKICCVRQLENPTIACRNDKNLLCALDLSKFIHSFIFTCFRRVTLQQSWFSRGPPLKRKKILIQGKIQLDNK